MENFKVVILSIVGNLITPFVITLGGIAASYFSPFTNEIRLIILNTALILSAIILILSQRFAPQRTRVIKTNTANHTYLIQKNVARHIPDGETFNYLGEIYGFHFGNVETIPHDAFIKQFSTGSTLPSILPHCQAFHEQKIKQK